MSLTSLCFAVFRWSILRSIFFEFEILVFIMLYNFSSYILFCAQKPFMFLGSTVKNDWHIKDNFR